MILSWRRRRGARRAEKTCDVDQNCVAELTIPINFRCPISLDLMKDPVTLSTGITYDRENIEKWMESGNNKCPMTKQQLTNQDPIPNHAIRKMIQNWGVENKSFGVERIPTPRIPISLLQVSEFVARVEAARQPGDSERCLELVAKIKDLAEESERNRRRLVASGAGRALSETFETFLGRTSKSIVPIHNSGEERSLWTENLCSGKNSLLCGEILSALTLMLPLDEEAKSHLCSFPSLNSMVWFMKCGHLSERRTAVLVMKDVISSDERKVNVLKKIDGAIAGLVMLIKEPICVKSTKASLSIIYSIVASLPSQQNNITKRFVEAGLVSVLLETLVDSERYVSEIALGVLDELCGCDEGREKAYRNALAVPVLVKKILRVSDLATRFSVSVLWKLSKNENRDEEGGEGSVFVIEALQVGAFQKLLLVLQVGCDEETKEKASQLLKLLNLFWERLERLECTESLAFKNLRRPF